jgi:hypothetical protein
MSKLLVKSKEQNRVDIMGDYYLLKKDLVS